MADIVNTLLPVFLLILAGSLMRHAGFPGDGFWPAAERLIYFVLFPALIVGGLARTDISLQAFVHVAGVLCALVLAVAGVLLWLRPHLGVDGPGFTSVFQGAVRFNTFIGLAVADAVHGPAGVALTAMVLVALIPVVNVCCVGVLARYASPVSLSAVATLAALARNPLIIACVVGAAFQVTGTSAPSVLDGILEVLGRGALPLALLVVGAGLRWRGVREGVPAIALSTAMKLVAMPLAAWLVCLALGIRGLEASIAVMFAALPGASSSYILASQLGGDRVLMAAILTVQTGLAVVTLPLFVALAAGAA